MQVGATFPHSGFAEVLRIASVPTLVFAIDFEVSDLLAEAENVSEITLSRTCRLRIVGRDATPFNPNHLHSSATTTFHPMRPHSAVPGHHSGHYYRWLLGFPKSACLLPVLR